MDVNVDENSSRSEKILGKMAGKYSGELEEPQSRIEALLLSLMNKTSQLANAELKFETVDSLPATGDLHTVYLVPHAHGEKDAYDEYLFTNGSFEKIGNTDIDLSQYAKKSDIPTKVSDLENDSGYLTQHQDLSDYAKKEDLDKVTEKDEEVTQQQEELAVDYPSFILVDSKDQMTDKRAIYLMQNGNSYTVYIYTRNWNNNGAVEFTPYGSVSNDLSRYKPIDAMVSFIWSFSDPRSEED